MPLCFLHAKTKVYALYLERLTTYTSTTTVITATSNVGNSRQGAGETGRGGKPSKGREALGPRPVVFQSWWPPLSSYWMPGEGKPGGRAFIPGTLGFPFKPELAGLRLEPDPCDRALRLLIISFAARVEASNYRPGLLSTTKALPCVWGTLPNEL